jgi:hypothetical protein
MGIDTLLNSGRGAIDGKSAFVLETQCHNLIEQCQTAQKMTGITYLTVPRASPLSKLTTKVKKERRKQLSVFGVF